MRYLAVILCVICCINGIAQQQLPLKDIRSEWRNRFWPAYWITHPSASTSDWGIFHFRKTFRLESVPERFVAHVSGDNRYRLFVNGSEVVHGPSRDDLDHWRFESVDLSPYLRKGENLIAAVVWNFGSYRPVFQQSFATAFLLQADDPAHQVVNTGAEGWKVFNNEAYSAEMQGIWSLQTYHVTGPGERLDASLYPWNWEQPGFDDKNWVAPRRLEQAHSSEEGTVSTWGLTHRTLPLMEDRPVRLGAVRKAEGLTIGDAFIRGEGPLILAANSRATILFDQGHLTNAYPVLISSGGRGSQVTLTYSEALYVAGAKDNHEKGHRDSINGKVMRGQQDVFLPDGGRGRVFRPLSFRTYRYLQLELVTGAEPLTIHDLYGRFTGYPFQEKGRFAGSDPGLARIWDAGWRTARLCAGETYYDCPYYEQLQYVGDTRIQALISLYAAGDDRLMRQAIDVYDHSREAHGLTHSRYPEGRPVQFIPPYSLFWVSMVHDYWLHREDPAFVEGKLRGVQTVLDWFEHQIDPGTGLLGDMPYWNFVDWSWPWDSNAQLGGVPPVKGGSSIMSLHYAYTLDAAAELCRAFKRQALADHYARLSAQIRQRTLALCWDERRGLFADTPAKNSFSQHANILGVLTGAIPKGSGPAVMNRVLTDKDLTQATFYFQFYLFEAMRKTGAADQYIGRLQPWHDMLAQGLTTFAEEPDPTRSDCHAWSASPNYHLLSLVCGVMPASPGFRRVKIEPAMGDLSWIQGEIPHPAGPIRLRLERKGTAGLNGTINLPQGLEGEFLWKGKKLVLKGGENKLSL